MSLSILSYKPEHDGCLVWVSGGDLRFSVEGEKDSYPRYAGMSSLPQAIRLLSRLDRAPDVLALGGFEFFGRTDDYKGKYNGIGPETISCEEKKVFGQKLLVYESSHERAHVWGTYGMSPFPQGQPVYVLIWEGSIGRFYEVGSDLTIRPLDTVLDQPGWRYSIPYAVADHRNRKDKDLWFFDLSDAGKMMALGAYGAAMPKSLRKDWQGEVRRFLEMKIDISSMESEQATIQAMKASALFDVGVESPEFKDFSDQLSDAIFDKFHVFAHKNLTKRLPLLIGGGCGLNCGWNSRWKDSGLFDGVFVPPCTNDSGIAIGMAVDAQRHLGGSAKISWSAYAGEDFMLDDADLTGFQIADFGFEKVAELLQSGKVIAWVQGKAEIGPRALGHRSLLASPFDSSMLQRLNGIKKREGFRPIAPICLEEEVERLFEWKGASPHMLYFQRVRTKELKAVTHVDNSARLQSVTASEQPEMTALLTAFKAKTGFGVLCNTSLNFKGKGFINRLSDLAKYSRESGLDGFVVGLRLYLRKD